MKLKEFRKNTHQTHAEDLVLLGKEGLAELNDKIDKFLRRFSSEDKELNLTQKIDGAPALFCWSSYPGYPDNSIALKGFTSGPQNAISSIEDINNKTGGKEVKELQALSKLSKDELMNDPTWKKYAKKYGDDIESAIRDARANFDSRENMRDFLEYGLQLAKYIPAGECWQGDCLFSKNSKKEEEINGTRYITFMPNKIVYAFGEDNADYNKVKNSDFGIAFHTIYKDKDGEMRQGFDVDPTKLNTPDNFYIMSPAINASKDKADYDLSDIEAEYANLKQLEQKLINDPAYEELINNVTFMNYWNTFENANLADRKQVNLNTTTFIADLKDYVKDKLDKEYNKKLADADTDKKKQNAINKYNSDLEKLNNIIDSHKDTLHNLVECLNSAANIKMLMWAGLKKAKNDYSTFYKSRTKGYIPSEGEGIAMSDMDGNIVKIVDRSTFSSYNRDPDIMSGFEHESLQEEFKLNSKLEKLLGDKVPQFIEFIKKLNMEHKAYDGEIHPLGLYVEDRDKGTKQEKVHDFWLKNFGLDTAQRGVGSAIASALIDMNYELKNSQEYKDTLDDDDTDKLPEDEQFKINLFYEWDAAKKNFFGDYADDDPIRSMSFRQFLQSKLDAGDYEDDHEKQLLIDAIEEVKGGAGYFKEMFGAATQMADMRTFAKKPVKFSSKKKLKLEEDDQKTITAYHGSKKKFNDFEISKIGSNIGTDNFDFKGIYLTDSKDFAKGYAIDKASSSYIDKNGEEHTTISDASDGYVYTCTLMPKKPLVIDIEGNEENKNLYWARVKDQDKIVKQGYDLICHLNIPYTDENGKSNGYIGNEYVVLDPSIIKINKIEHFNDKGKLLKEDSNKKKTAVVAFGRFNPPTIGHKKLIDTMVSVSKGEKPKLYLSHSVDSKKNPLSYDSKIRWTTKAFSDEVDVIKGNYTNMFDIMSDLYKDGYTDIIYVGGEDRVGDDSKLIGWINQYNGKPDKKGNILYDFNSINFVNSGKRSGDDLISNASASLARKYVLENNFDHFKQIVPFSENDAKQLFRELKYAMTGKEESFLEACNQRIEDLKNMKVIHLDEAASIRPNKPLGNLLKSILSTKVNGLSFTDGNPQRDPKDTLRIASSLSENDLVKELKKALTPTPKDTFETKTNQYQIDGIDFDKVNKYREASGSYNAIPVRIKSLDGKENDTLYITLKTSENKSFYDKQFTPNKVLENGLGKFERYDKLVFKKGYEDLRNIYYQAVETVEGDLSHYEATVSNMTGVNEMNVNAIMKDFGEVLSAGCLANLLGEPRSVFFPTASNEALIDFIVNGSIKVSQKAGTGAKPSGESMISTILASNIDYNSVLKGYSKSDISRIKNMIAFFDKYVYGQKTAHLGYKNLAALLSGQNNNFIKVPDVSSLQKYLKDGSVTPKNITKFIKDITPYVGDRIKFNTDKLNVAKYCDTLRIRYLARIVWSSINKDKVLIEGINKLLNFCLGEFIQVYLINPKEFIKGHLIFEVKKIDGQNNYEFIDKSEINKNNFELYGSKLGIQLRH